MQQAPPAPASLAKPRVPAGNGNCSPPASDILLPTNSRPAAPPRASRDREPDGPLTKVTLVWREGVREDWLKFGKPVSERILSRSARIESFAPGQVFALVRWASNDFGTIRSTIAVVRAVAADRPCTTVAQVDPGGELLLFARGWHKVAHIFRLIDAVETSGIDPCEVAPEHWRHVHNRLAGRERAASYGPAQHRAWLLRKALGA